MGDSILAPVWPRGDTGACTPWFMPELGLQFQRIWILSVQWGGPVIPAEILNIPKSLLAWKPFMILLIKYRMLGFRYDGLTGARYASLHRDHISFQNIMSWIRYQELGI